MSTSNKRLELKSALIVAITASFLSACGGSGGGASGNLTERKEVAGRVVKGPVGNATIDVRTVNPFTGSVSETVLATTTTSADGSFEFDFTTVQGALMIETRGGSFIDESDQNTDGGEPRSIQLGPQDGFRVYRPSGVGNVAVTAITDAITARAFGIAMQNQISLDNAFESVRSLTEQALGFDPLTTPALNPLNPSSTDPDAIKYALTLGGLAVASHQIAIAAGMPQANGEVIQAVVQDLLDGRLDGQSDGDPITLNGQDMPDIDLNAAINVFLNNNRPAYGEVATPSVNEQVWSSEPSVSNTPPSIDVIPAATFIPEGGTLLLDSNVLTVSDTETATADLRFLVLQPPSSGTLTDGTTTLQEGSLTSSTLRYQNQTFPGGAGDFITIAVVDADNGFAPIGFPIVVNGIPTAVDDSATTLEDTLVNIDVVDNDSDPENATLNITNITNVSGGTPSVNGNTIDFLPAPNFNGAAGFSYSATDGFHTVSANVVVNVTAVNDAPTISDIAEQTTGEDIALSGLGFGVGDVETPANDLTIQAVSSNQTLLSDNNIALGGSGNNRSLTLTPNPDQSGSTDITVTVNDGELSASDTFTLTVLAINDAPTISAIGDSTINENSSFGPITVAVGDIDNDASSLTVTAISSNGVLVPNGNINIGPGTAAENRALTISPAAHESGVAVISVTVSDGQLTATESFTLTVNDTDSSIKFVAPVAQGNEDCSSPSNVCDSPAQALAAAVAGNEVWMATGTYGLISLAEQIALKDQVTLRGGYNASDFGTAPSEDPSLTVVQATFDQNSQATLECGNSISNLTKVENLTIEGSSSGANTVAVRASGSCNAVLHNNLLVGGAGSNQSIGLLVQLTAGNVLVAEANRIDGGISPVHAQAVRSLSGGLVLFDSVLFGGVSSSGNTEAVLVQNPTSDGVKIENNLISGGVSQSGFVTGILFEGSGYASVVNNTIYGGQSDAVSAALRFSDSTNGAGEPDIVNNILQADSDQVGTSQCIRQESTAQSEPNKLRYNSFSDCDFYLTNSSGPGVLAGREQLEDYVGLQDPGGIDLLSPYAVAPNFVNENGLDSNKATPFDNDWNLAPGSDCPVVEGGVIAITGVVIPAQDAKQVDRTAIVSGRCAYAQPFYDFSGSSSDLGVSLGALEALGPPALYVSNAGDDAANCLDPVNPCLTIERALGLSQAGDEIRVENGSYDLSGADGRITQPISLVGGYDIGFVGLPECSGEVCNTNIGLQATPAVEGNDRDAVVVCDGTAGGMTQSNTLIAGFAIDGTDVNREFGISRAVVVTNGCNATVASNQILGSDCNTGGNTTSIGVSIESGAAAGTVPRIFNNEIVGGTNCATESIGIQLADNTLPAVPSNRIVIEKNKIVGADPEGAPQGALTDTGLGLSIGKGATSSTGTLLLVENSIDAGVARYTRGVSLNGFGDVNINANRIYGGLAGGGFSDDLSSYGMVALIYGDLQVYNNYIHGGAYNGQGVDAFTQGLRIGGIGSTGKLTLRNNTVFSGLVPSNTQRALLLAPPESTGPLAQTFIDNNILFTPESGGQDRRCIEEETAMTPDRVANNLFYNCDGQYMDKSPDHPNDPPTNLGANTTENNASNNVVSNALSGPALEFEDEDGSDNDLGSSDFDWQLHDGSERTATDCVIAEGALDGTAQNPAFIYNNDVTMKPRTGNGSTGWSMGAHEQDNCSSGQP